MEAIGEAVTEGRTGDLDAAHRRLLDLWSPIGVSGDPQHRCSLAHYLADPYDDPAEALTWDVRALDAADTVTEQRVREHHAGLRVDAFILPRISTSPTTAAGSALSRLPASTSRRPRRTFPTSLRISAVTSCVPPCRKWPRPSPGGITPGETGLRDHLPGVRPPAGTPRPAELPGRVGQPPWPTLPIEPTSTEEPPPSVTGREAAPGQLRVTDLVSLGGVTTRPVIRTPEPPVSFSG